MQFEFDKILITKLSHQISVGCHEPFERVTLCAFSLGCCRVQHTFGADLAAAKH